MQYNEIMSNMEKNEEEPIIVIHLAGLPEDQLKAVEALEIPPELQGAALGADLDMTDYTEIIPLSERVRIEELLKSKGVHHVEFTKTKDRSHTCQDPKIRAQYEIYRVREEFLSKLHYMFAEICDGTHPERSFPKLFIKAFPQMKWVISEVPDLTMFQDPRGHWNVVNLKAIKLIMDKYVDFFPEEARTNPERWLRENLNLWSDPLGDPDFTHRSIRMIRYGLISGFDLVSVKLFAKRQLALDILRERTKDLGYPNQDYINFADGEMPDDRKEEFLAAANLGEEELRLLAMKSLEHSHEDRDKYPFMVFDEGAYARYDCDLAERLEYSQVDWSELRRFFDHEILHWNVPFRITREGTIEWFIEKDEKN